ncbi:MAG: hypothetical protein J6X39_06035 [Bacteroidales bacterium]|nr:hypothetical protein [Bacteroidales bacterium]
MADNYIRKQHLQIDQNITERVRRLINAYAAKSSGNPFGSFGDEITITNYEYSPIYGARFSSQFDIRTVEAALRPCRNPGKYGSGAQYTRPGSVPVWDFALNTTTRFANKKEKFEVQGSHHEETCPNCSGRGTTTCSVCGGSGTRPCYNCGGKGYTTYSSYEETGYRKYSDGHTEPIYGYVTRRRDCSYCSDGKVSCTHCSDGQVTCRICEGCRSIVRFLTIDQTLEAAHSWKFIHDSKILKVAEIADNMSKLPAVALFQKSADSLAKGVYTEDSELASAIDRAIGEHDSRVDGASHILFQEAAVTKVDLYWVDYNYKGKHYYGAIIGDRYYDGLSPLSEYAFKLVKKARKRVGGLGTASAQRLLDEAKTLSVYGLNTETTDIQGVVSKQFEKLYNFGVSLMSWIVVLFVTPFVFNFYEVFNPVLKYAHFVNDPNWAPYGSLPGIQSVIFIILMMVLAQFLLARGHEKRHYSVFGYVFSGLGLYLAAALGVLVVMLGLNFVGLSMISGWIGFLIWKLILLAIIVLVFAGAIIVWAVKKIIGLLVALWHLIF